MSRKRCADIKSPDEDEDGGVFDERWLPELPDGYVWKHQSWGKNPVVEDWWYISPTDEGSPKYGGIIWLTGGNKSYHPTKYPHFRAGIINDRGWWWKDPAEAVVMLMARCRLGLSE